MICLLKRTTAVTGAGIGVFRFSGDACAMSWFVVVRKVEEDVTETMLRLSSSRE